MADIVDLLIDQHRQVETLFDAGDEPGVVRALRRHDRIETELLYVEADAAGLDVTDARSDHSQTRTLLDRIDAGEDGLVDQLRSLVAAHVAEEESGLLPAVREAVPVERREELGRQAEAITV